MPVETELYDLLEVPANASPSEIKKAYRKKALVHHPDKGGDSQKFQKINMAYEILSDTEKRDMYDKYGKNGLKNSGVVPEDILTKMFGNMFDINGIFNMYQRAKNVINKSPIVIHEYSATLEDLCTRKIVKLRFVRQRVCPCIDNGDNCKECSGTGRLIKTRKIGPGIIQQLPMKCPSCIEGKIYKYCSKCNKGLRELPKTFQLQLSPELQNGHKFIFEREGNQMIGKTVGDFVVILKYKHHNLFTVKKSNLFCDVQITLKEALCGHTKMIPHPSGEDVVIAISDITEPGHVESVKGKGMTSDSKLVVKYEILFPKSLSKDSKKILGKLLP